MPVDMLAIVEWRPPLPVMLIVGVLGACVAAGLLLRLMWRPAESRRPSWTLLLLRAVTLLGLLTLLFGPVHVEETDGLTSQRELFLLVDGSESMDIGGEESRWESAWSMLSQAQASFPDGRNTEVPVFWFGHRVHGAGAMTDVGASDGGALPEGPDDSDTRLADALNQLTRHFGRQPPAGVVVMSDGRVRDSAAVEAACSTYTERHIPVHVVPLGDSDRGGDVAIVSVVAPERVRKYADVEVQVFFRSFGYTGTRTLVEIASHSVVAGTETEVVLASVPITLRGGAQSATLSFRSGLEPTQLEIRIPVQADEISTRNNSIKTDVAIDRTRIRVLYLQSADEPIRVIPEAGGVRYEGPHTPLQDALNIDEDVVCVSFVKAPGFDRFQRLRDGPGTGSLRYPRSLVELSSYDCVIISDVAAGQLNDLDSEWIARWVENRGGGLWMAGGANSFHGGGWDRSALADVLPVTTESARWDETDSLRLDESALEDRHPLLRIVSDPEQNAAVLEAMPSIEAWYSGLTAKPSADVVMAAMTAKDEAASPLVVVGRYGRGRTVATAFPITKPAAGNWLTSWGPEGTTYSAQFCRNIVYWLTEGSQIGRRRLSAHVDKRFYRPGETVTLEAAAYDETAYRTTDYRVWAMIEPRTLDFTDEMLFAPVKWPSGAVRESGESGPLTVWGEEFEVPRDPQSGTYQLPLDLADTLQGGASGQGLRIELTAYEGSVSEASFGRGTQVDSTSLSLQILDDPFERQNPFPNHDLLQRVASLTGGSVVTTADELVALIDERPVTRGPSQVSVQPAWAKWWVWTLIFLLLTVEWTLRRTVGMA